MNIKLKIYYKICKIVDKITQFLQFKPLQPFYFLLYKTILLLMNYWTPINNDWEIKTLKLINNYLSNSKKFNPIIFDVWANIGQYLDNINSNIKIPSIIYSFEPQSNIYKLLQNNMPKNTIHTINLVNLGLWIKRQKVEIFSGNDENSTCASIKADNIENFVSEIVNKESIQIDTLDNFCKENNIKHINHLKIDVEWNELNVLKWVEKMIKWEKIDIIQVEHNRCAIAFRTFFRDYWNMFNEKYVICRPLAWNRWLYEIKKYNHYLESFTYINYVFIKKDIYEKYF
jgi:FkbM family methyltransferase